MENSDVADELASFLQQFYKLYPTYIGKSHQSYFNKEVYLFGESYGGTYVLELAQHLLIKTSSYLDKPLPFEVRLSFLMYLG